MYGKKKLVQTNQNLNNLEMKKMNLSYQIKTDFRKFKS